MAACTNNGGSRARRAVTAALVGVLSVGTVPMVALATGAEDGIQVMASDLQSWQAGDFKFNVEPDAEGSYALTEGDVLSIESVEQVDGTVLTASDVTLVFFNRGIEGGLTSGSANTVTSSGITVDQNAGTMPIDDGKYWAVVFEGDVVDATGKLLDITDTTNFSTVCANNGVYAAFPVTVKQKVTSLADAQVFEFDATASDEGVSDGTLSYTGGVLKVGFKLGNKKLVPGNDYNVAWIQNPATTANDMGDCYELGSTTTPAGTYVARLSGINDYAGSSVDVTFQVGGIDLSTASVSIAPAVTGTGFYFDATGTNVLKNSEITVDGVALEDSAQLTSTLVAVNDAPVSSSTDLTANGKYTFTISANSGQSSVKGSKVVDAYVVDEAVVYTYLGSNVSGLASNPFAPAMGYSFTPDGLGAKISTKKVDFTYTVTKDGQAVTSYDEPGTYLLVLDTPIVQNADGKYLYAGHEEVEFKVSGASYANSKLYVSYDGKNIAGGDDIEYTGNAIEPTVVVRDADNEKLTEGTDYTWKLVDANGNEVESATEVGAYKVVVTYNGDDTGAEKELAFDIKKAEIESAKATADFFGIPAEGAATPTFVGYTQPGLKGQEFELTSDLVSVRYYETVDNDDDGEPDMTGAKYDKGDAVKAEDLTEEGTYVAVINVLTTAKNIEGSKIEALFTLSETAGFVDVDANAWYAQAVQEAYNQYYVNGIGGTNVFMPGADITRADAVGIIYNMAGGHADDDFSFDETGGYITGFSDVDGHAYYAKAIAWAKASGVVNGHAGAFNPDAKITRQEFAAMLANYAKATGKFVAPSADALDGISDAASVDAWATESVAWAVENGVMGNAGSVWAGNTITRAEVAAMAVNYQPENLEGYNRVDNPRPLF